MKVSSNLASRLSFNAGGGIVKKSSQKVPTALIGRLGLPESGNARVRVTGIKARLGIVRNVLTKTSHSYFSPYPTKQQDTEQNLYRKVARSTALPARRRLGTDAMNPASPVRVKIVGGRMVGGMRSDQLTTKEKGGRSLSERIRAPVVSVDAQRGLTVSVRNRMFPRREPFNRTQRSRPYYDEHDDRGSGPELQAKERRQELAAPECVQSEDSDDVNMELKGRRRPYISEPMDVDSASGGGVYNPSVLFTRTTHHHHRHVRSPSIEEQYITKRVVREDELPGLHQQGPLPPVRKERELYSVRRARLRQVSPPSAVRYTNYSPPPQPPSFHPRQVSNRLLSLSSKPLVSKKKRAATDDRPRIKASTAALSQALSSKIVKRTKLMKPAKKVRNTSTLKMRSKLVNVKRLRSRKSSEEESEESESEESDESSDNYFDDEEISRVYKPPPERVIPTPHKQELDPHVLESIATLQGKQPGYKSGPGPGVKNLLFVPCCTAKSLNQRFTSR